MRAATWMLGSAFVCASSSLVFAEDSPASGNATPAGPVSTASRIRDPSDGKFDISAYLATPKRFLPVPIVVTEPAVGYGGGLAGMFIRPREQAGDEGYARPNISVLGGFATENGTWGALVGDSSRWMDDRVHTLAGAGVGELHLDFYGLGDASDSLDEAVSYQLDFAMLLLHADWKPRPRSNWSIGMRYVYSQIEPKLEDAPQFPGLADNIDMKICAPSAVLGCDSRNSLFTWASGMYAVTMYLLAREDT